MAIYAAITPTTCNVTRYRKIKEFYEIYELVYRILDEEENEELEKIDTEELLSLWGEEKI